MGSALRQSARLVICGLAGALAVGGGFAIASWDAGGLAVGLINPAAIVGGVCGGLLVSLARRWSSTAGGVGIYFLGVVLCVAVAALLLFLAWYDPMDPEQLLLLWATVCYMVPGGIIGGSLAQLLLGRLLRPAV